MDYVVELLSCISLLNCFCSSLFVYPSTKQWGLHYSYSLVGRLCNTDIISTCSNILRLFHGLPTKDDGTQLHQISHTWPIASKNTLFSLIEPDRRKNKTQPTICCLEVAIDKTFYPNIFRHLMRIQCQMDWKRKWQEDCEDFWDRSEKWKCLFQIFPTFLKLAKKGKAFWI